MICKFIWKIVGTFIFIVNFFLLLVFGSQSRTLEGVFFKKGRCPLREKCPYSELFWSVFSRIRTEYGEILRIPPSSFRIWEDADQNNSEYRHFSRSH